LSRRFCEEDIDQILQRSESSKGAAPAEGDGTAPQPSMFSKASFVAGKSAGASLCVSCC